MLDSEGRSFRRTFAVRFCDKPDVVVHEVQPDGFISLYEWIPVRTMGNSVKEKKLYDTPEARYRIKRAAAPARRSAIATALSLAALLGIPACSAASTGYARMIADTGCGKDMVSSHSFSRKLLEEHSRKRTNPLRMQTANGTVELDTEIRFRID